jgi:CDP-glucose 4,6-dehydratase
VETMVGAHQRLSAVYNGKRVFVTGHTGFKGSWLSLWLTKLGAEVTGFSDSVPTVPSHIERLDLGIREIWGDVADAEALTAAVRESRPEIIFHLAAQSLVRQAYTQPLNTYRTNVIGTLCVFEAARASNSVRAIVSATTDKVYKNREWDWAYREIDELGGLDPYSASKSCVEIMTDSYTKSFLGGGDLRIASVRAGNVIGGGDWAADRLIPDIMRAAHGGESVRIRNPLSVRPWQHVLDPLAGYLDIGCRLLEGRREMESAWNFGPVSAASVSVQDIIATMKARMPSLHAVFEPQAGSPPESRLLRVDCSKAVSRLGWRPLWEDQMFERTIEWYRSFYEDNKVISEQQLDDYASMLD